MTTPNKFFLVNKLDSILSTRDGTLDIPPKGYAKIREQDQENLTILYATERNWAEIVNVEPKSGAVVVEDVKVEITEPYQGMTIDELKADQLTKATEATAKVAEEADTAPKAKKGK